jgi:hypothetical protein
MKWREMEWKWYGDGTDTKRGNERKIGTWKVVERQECRLETDFVKKWMDVLMEWRVTGQVASIDRATQAGG